MAASNANKNSDSPKTTPQKKRIVKERTFQTSNLKSAAAPPKMEEAKCTHIRRDNPEESKPPRYRYSLRLATKAAPEKQAKAKEVPTHAVTITLEK